VSRARDVALDLLDLLLTEFLALALAGAFFFADALALEAPRRVPAETVSVPTPTIIARRIKVIKAAYAPERPLVIQIPSYNVRDFRAQPPPAWQMPDRNGLCDCF
jgi:hypothetical protein